MFILSSPVVHFSYIDTVDRVYYQLSNSDFNGFPVINSVGQPIGIVERDTLILLIKKNAWYSINRQTQDLQKMNSTIQEPGMQEPFAPHEGYDQDQNDATAQDQLQHPRQPPILNWEDLTQDFASNSLDHKEVADIANANKGKYLDFRPYMIERPFYVCQKDTLEKCHTIFRHIHVRQLMVVNNRSERLEGIITRQDLFQYMSL